MSIDRLTQAFSRLTRSERQGVIAATQTARNRNAELPDHFSQVLAEVHALVANAAAEAQAHEDALLHGLKAEMIQDRRKRLGLDETRTTWDGDKGVSAFDR